VGAHSKDFVILAYVFLTQYSSDGQTHRRRDRRFYNS